MRAKWIGRFPGTKDDLDSLLNEALCVAASRYDSSMGTAFSTYAWATMEGYIKTEIGNVTKKREAEVYVEDLCPSTIEGRAIKVEGSTEKERRFTPLTATRIELTNRTQEQIIKMLVEHPNTTIEEIAEELQLTKGHVRDVVKLIAYKLEQQATQERG